LYIVEFYYITFFDLGGRETSFSPLSLILGRWRFFSGVFLSVGRKGRAFPPRWKRGDYLFPSPFLTQVMLSAGGVRRVPFLPLQFHRGRISLPVPSPYWE